MRTHKFILANKDDEGNWWMSFPLTIADLIDGGHVDTFDEKTIVREFTGRHDKNGKEIFEGDIVKSFHFADAYGEKIKETIFEVEFTFNAFRGIYLDIENRGEIIGNIYENPDLLTKQTGK